MELSTFTVPSMDMLISNMTMGSLQMSSFHCHNYHHSFYSSWLKSCITHGKGPWRSCKYCDEQRTNNQLIHQNFSHQQEYLCRKLFFKWHSKVLFSKAPILCAANVSCLGSLGNCIATPWSDFQWNTHEKNWNHGIQEMYACCWLGNLVCLWNLYVRIYLVFSVFRFHKMNSDFSKSEFLS